MIDHHLDRSCAILHVRPQSALEKSDFEELAREVDPFIEGVSDLAGMVIETPGFPGWSSFGAMVAHLRFVKDHHRHVKRIALVTDSPVGEVAERFGSHFVAAEIRLFPAGELGAARQWILGG
jgi:hypothetical protein